MKTASTVYHTTVSSGSSVGGEAAVMVQGKRSASRKAVGAVAATHLQSAVPIDVEDAILSIGGRRFETHARFPVDAPRLRVIIHGASEEGGIVLGVEVIASCTSIGVVRGENDVSMGIPRSGVAAFAYEDVSW